MMKPMTQPSLIALSERAYRALLIFYPADYRREYGALMAQVFRDMCRHAYRQKGPYGVLGVWLPVLLDLAITAVEEHRKGEIRMSRSTLARWSGLILVIGGILFTVASFSQLQPGSHYSFHGLYQVAVMMIIPAIFLLALGLVGVRAQLANRLNLPGKWGLNLAIAGAIIHGITWLGLIVFDGLYTVAMVAFGVHLVGLMLFGISAIQTKTFSRWNALPILIGLSPFLMFLNNQQGIVYGPQYESFAAVALMGLGYVLLGYVVYADMSRQERAAA
jgi:hypothetical protein